MRLKIAHFILNMTSGGAEKLVRTLCFKLDYFDFNVICFDSITDYFEDFKKKNIPLLLFKRRQCFIDFSIIRPLIHYIKYKNINIIHTHDISSLLYGIIVGKISRCKIIFTEHSRHYIEEKFKRQVEKRFLCNFVDKVIEVSPELKEASIKKDKISMKKIEVIENGVDVELFRNANPLGLREKFNLKSTTKLLLIVGRLEKIKGQHYAIQALVSPILKEEDIVLFLVGDGYEKKYLKRLSYELGIGHKVIFLGIRKDIPQIMVSCDLLIIPSESEGLPFVLLEGMAAGIPIISTSVGRIPKIIGKNERGLLVSPKDTYELARKIKFAIYNKEYLKILSSKAQKFVEENYSESKMLAKYKKIYEEIG